MSVIDAKHFFINVVNNLIKGTINIHSPLEELVIRNCGKDLAYVDNRRDAKQYMVLTSGVT